MSRLVIGTAQWGMKYGIANKSGIPDENSCRAMLSLAKSSGVDLLDTARAYGTAEERLGRLITPSWRIATKTDPSASTVAGLEASLETSLRCLGRERVEWLFLHRPEQKRVGAGAGWRYLKSQLALERVGKLGVSVVSASQAYEELEADLDGIQVPASLGDRRLKEGGFFDAARAAGIQVFVRSVFLQGALLLDPSDLPESLTSLRDPLRAVRSWVRESGRPMVEVCLAYVRDAIPGVGVVVGVESVQQLTQLLSAWNSPRLAPNDLDELETLLQVADERVLDPALW